MKIIKEDNTIKTALFGAVLVLLTLAILLPAQSVGSISFRYGKLERSKEVTRAFESLQISSDYTYFYSGQGNIPTAIIGVVKTHRLRPGLWKPVELTQQKLRGWVRQMDIVYDGFQPYGFHILDDNGNQIGIWYSSKQWTTVIVEAENQIAVFTPEPPGFRTRQ